MMTESGTYRPLKAPNWRASLPTPLVMTGFTMHGWLTGFLRTPPHGDALACA